MNMTKFKSREVLTGLLVFCTIAVYGQSNLTSSATASADTFHLDYQATAAIDRDTSDGAGWAVTATFDIVPHWLELNWASPLTVNRIVLFTDTAEDGAYALRAYDI